MKGLNTEMINIKDLNKAEVLAALYNASRPLGLGLMHWTPEIMTKEEAENIIKLGDDKTQMFPNLPKKYLYFDYLKGRVMKVNLSGDEFEERLYDRDNGNGAAYNALKELLK
jgi:hypothetical protein